MGNAKTKEILTKFFEFNMIGENDIDVLFDTYDKNKVRKNSLFFFYLFFILEWCIRMVIK